MSPVRVRYRPAARADIKNVLKWSLENFGPPAMRRYERLLLVAISEIASDSELRGSYGVRGMQQGIRFYHLRHSRDLAGVDGQTVKEPRHLIVYSVGKREVTIVRVLHERMEVDARLSAP